MYKGRCSWRRTGRDVAARQDIRLDNPIKSFTRRQRISIRKQFPLSLQLVSPWYLLNVMKWASHSFLVLFFSSLSPIVHSSSRASYGSRKRIDNGHGHVGYTKIVCLLEKPVRSSRCRYPTYTVDYVIVVTCSSQIAAKERFSQQARALESFMTVVRST